MPDKNYQKFAAEKLASIYEVAEYERILTAFREKDPAFLKVSPEKFGLEYLGMQLALSCHAWSRSCRENRLKDPGIENLFFKTVMQSFQSSKFVDIAAVFSEYLHAPETDKQPLLPVAGLMMRRLGLAKEMGSMEKPVLSPGFRLLVEIEESLKNSFENDFFEFSVSS